MRGSVWARGITFLRKSFSFFTREEKREFVFLCAVALLMAILEVAGIASLLPFLRLVSNPDSIHSNELLSFLWVVVGSPELNSFLFVIGLGVFFIVVGGNLFKTYGTYRMLLFSNMKRHSISYRLFERYLYRDYEFFLQRNTSDLAKNILTEVEHLVTHIFTPLMHLLAHGVIVLSILLMLLFFDWQLSLVAGGVLGGSYAMLFLYTKRKIRSLAKKREALNRTRFQAVSESLTGIKELKLFGREAAFVDRFMRASYSFSRGHALHQVYTNAPKYLIEGVAFGGILLIVLFLIVTARGVEEAIPMIGLYAFAGYKLMPSLQFVFNSIAQMRYSTEALTAVQRDFAAGALTSGGQGGESSQRVQPLTVQSSIELMDIVYRYPAGERNSLAGINMVIPHQKNIGIVGSSGAGKSTLVDVLLGILRPRSGKLKVDGQEITEKNMRSWQSSVGYVPQQIMLLDDTVAANIAFGVPEGERNQAAIEAAARISQIHDFVLKELPAGYDTVVGERGLRLSGGQRQRIGIARALYHNPQVVVMDEATSALDNLTEKAFMESIERLAGEKTLIMIAHRLTTIEKCDLIFFMDNGRVAASGTYRELLESNAAFAELARSHGEQNDSSEPGR